MQVGELTAALVEAGRTVAARVQFLGEEEEEISDNH